MMAITPASISDRSSEVVEEFELFDDWMERYEHLIELGRGLAPIPDIYRTDVYRVQGCQSQVWIAAEQTVDGRVVLHADSDAIITRGLVALLVRVLSEQPAAEIAASKMDFLEEIGMGEHLSSTRKNGLDAMIRRIKAYAEGMV